MARPPKAEPIKPPRAAAKSAATRPVSPRATKVGAGVEKVVLGATRAGADAATKVVHTVGAGARLVGKVRERVADALGKAMPGKSKAAPDRPKATPGGSKAAPGGSKATPGGSKAAAAKPKAPPGKLKAASDRPKAPPRRAAPPEKPLARTALGAGNAQVKPRTRPAPKSAPKTTSEAEALAAAEPKRPRARKRPAPMAPDRLELLVNAARKSLEDDKAEDVRVLDVTGRASFTDRIIVATGLADRQISAMATHLEEALAKEGLRLKRNAIEASPDWVLIDCGDLVIHLFKPEARETFRLEKMWGEDSPKADSGSGYEPG